MSAGDIHRKANPRSRLKLLPEELQARIFEVVEMGTLEEALEWLKDEMNPPILIGKSALADWAAGYRRKLYIQEAESDAAEMEDMLKRSSLQLTPEAIAAIANAVFLNRASKTQDAKTFTAVASIVQRSQELRASQGAHQDKMVVAHKKLELQQANLNRQLKELEMKCAQYEKEKAAVEQALAGAAKKGASKQLIEGVRAAMNFRPPEEAAATATETPKP